LKDETKQDQNKQHREYYERMPNKTKFLKNNYYALKQGNGYTSPPSSLPAHELKILKEYMHGINLKQLGDSLPHRKKAMVLMRFLKGKRNQQIKVHSMIRDQLVYTSGKVNVVGRDFVALTTINKRFWIPYSAIESANVPFGIPDMPNSHQSVIYDETLRRKLLTEFSTTVLKQDILKRQFYEEALHVHLQDWKGTNVKVYTKEAEYKGNIEQIDSKQITIKSFKKQSIIPLTEVQLIKRSTPLQLFSSFTQWLKGTISRGRKR